ncbi:MAG: sulfate ABC transporter permease subunit CysT, partial [Synechococcaceae bacterium WB9_2_112]|nr:sulfate ABC transporter permease subunit CysT [Synechococcaceae bacterium WB9_2_112]
MAAVLTRLRRLPRLSLPSWPWRITWVYLSVMLLLPIAAMLLKTAQVSPGQFWEIATSPEAVATYKISFGL